MHWYERSSYAGDQTYAPKTAAANEPEHYRVERVELGVDRLAMHPHVTGTGYEVKQAGTPPPAKVGK